MPVLHLNEEQVASLLDMPLAIEVMQEAFRRWAAGEADNVPRVRAKGKGILLHSMCAAADYLGLVGWKEYTTTRHGALFHVGLYDQESGHMVALLEADRLGQMRTGAVSGLAAKLLAPPEANRMGLLGTGWQAESQLAAVHAACGLQQARVYSRNAERRLAFAERMSQQLQLDVVPVEDPRQAVEHLPIVVTATNSRQPVLAGAWLRAPALVCAMGSNQWRKAEIDRETVRRAAAVVCDSKDACRGEAGDLAASLESGEFRWDDAIELRDVVTGQRDVRATSDIVLFKSVGLALEDVALGGKLLELARQKGLGRELSL